MLSSVAFRVGFLATFLFSLSLKAAARGDDAPTKAPLSPPPFELRDGDRVVFLGNTLIEREQAYGWWELMLTARYPDRKITFRNLGWSGDTVWAESRGIFDAPEKGYERMLADVAAIRPTVIFLGYGGNEAFAGEAGLPAFEKQFVKLLDDLTRSSAEGVRFVILSPLRHDQATSPVPDLGPINANIELYAESLRRIAKQKSLTFVNMLHAAQPAFGPSSDNGLQLTDFGYARAGLLLQEELFPETVGKHGDGIGETGPEFHKVEQLRQAIVAKNQLFFYKWRPQNFTYLFGFRKHEQGQNAAELEKFDALIAAQEAEIDRLKKPVERTYRLYRAGK